jgi:L,D-transpeptidase ErfK/SrfK
MKTIVSNTTNQDYLTDLTSTSETSVFHLKKQNTYNAYLIGTYIKRFFLITFIFGGTIGFAVLSVFILPAIENYALILKPSDNNSIKINQMGASSDNYIIQTVKNIKKLNEKLVVKTPKTSYLVVNTSGLCSTGSYIKLEGEGEQKWIFKTPRGEFKIRDKKVDPVWKKPDWAFIEEGLPVPSKNHASRFEYGTLGDYALILGDGYMIHGTLYQRFLGKPVTHGCVRLGDDDLKQVFSTLNIGSKVYIF